MKKFDWTFLRPLRREELDPTSIYQIERLFHKYHARECTAKV
jgi:hypothetical protein